MSAFFALQPAAAAGAASDGPEEQSPDARLTTSADIAGAAASPSSAARGVPAGFYFPSFPAPLQCGVCLAPWRKPVTFHPCGHTVCRRCTNDDLTQCPRCSTPCTHFSHPSADAIAEAKNVPLICEHCSWHGPRETVSRHTCQARQFDSAIAQLRRDPSSSKAWFMLGASLKGTAIAEINGQRVTKTDCYLRCLESDPRNAMAWGNVAAILDSTGTITVRGEVYNKKRCNIICLSLNPALPIPWFNLGNAMMRGDTEEINGVLVFKDTCYIRALTLDPRMFAAWHNLGLCLERDMVIDFCDREYDASMCFITAILIKPDFAESWSKLAVVGPENRSFLGKRWTSKECAAKALSLNKALAEPWLVLNRVMKVDEVVEISSRTYTKQQVEKRALKASLVVPQRPTANPATKRSSSGNSRGSRSSRDSSSRPGTPSEDARSNNCLVM